jgi:membrane protein implicated in regulation of membrane protease activity
VRICRCPRSCGRGPLRSKAAGAIVLQRVDANGGRVRIGGEEMVGRSYLEDQVIEPGTRVEVLKIQGATALVME